jgi:hypothetical protein
MVKTGKDDIKFIIIDPYGIVEKNISKIESFTMLSIIGALRGELTEDEGALLIQSIIPKLTRETATEKWLKIIESESKKTVRLWEKRKSRIMTDLRYSQLFNKDELKIRIRKNLAVEQCIELDSVISIYKKTTNDDFQLLELNPQDAEKYWLESFRKEFHRLPQQLPLAWIKKDNEKDILIIENSTAKCN